MTGLNLVEEPALDEILAPHQYGQVTIWREGRDWAYVVMVRPGLPAEELKDIERHVAVCLAQLLETQDPDRNGWFPSASGPGCWFMTLATYELPDMGFLDTVGGVQR